MIHHRPRPRTDLPRPPGALPVAGSAHVWFDTVDDARGAGRPHRADGLDAETRTRLSGPRPLFPGLPSHRPLVMGILNVTPDSFSDGGRFLVFDAAVDHGRALAAAGADILDIGGESTRPGAADVVATTEIDRTAPVIMALRRAGIELPISIDTRKAAVAEAALDAGASMVNDVSALGWDAGMAGLVARSGVPVCLMHAQGTPQTMQLAPEYGDVLAEVAAFLADRIASAASAGIAPDRIAVDPGIGFGKTAHHNLTLLRGLSRFHDLGCALLVGASRKRFIGTIGGAPDGPPRMPGSVAVALHAAAQGAHVIRVHDVEETVQALRLWQALTTEDTA